ncbi:MAG: hypothetical protein ACK4IA_16470 [Paracoccus hibiscisoli]|uniref:hypothetical protein n=1 Tax=Paracoccus hibiscisoli TaxID=2023261 RepID=UPI00391A262F
MKIVNLESDAVAFEGPLFPPARVIKTGVLAEIGAEPVPAVPEAFQPSAWSVSTGVGSRQIVLDITALPDSGGMPIEAIQYNIGAGWIAISGTGTGVRNLTMENAAASYTFTLRAVNALGAGLASATKTTISSIDIQDFYGTGAGQVPMDHRYAEGAQSGGNLLSVPNLGGAGSLFNLTTVGTIPVAAPYVTVDPSDRFEIANRVELVGARMFIVADIKALGVNQFFAGRNVTGEVTNVLLNGAGTTITLNRNPGTGFVNAAVPMDPVVTAGLRLYEFEAISGGNISVWVNTVLRGTIANPHATFGVSRISAGQSTASGLTADLYRTLLQMTGGDYEARVEVIRARVNTEYGLGY